MRSNKLLLLASALAVTASPFVMADALVNVKSEVVRYDDLRLTSRVGVAVLYGRLRSAAERACAPLESQQLAAKGRYRACYDDAMARAVAGVNHAGLTEYYESKKGLVPVPPVVAPEVTVVATARP